MKCPHCGKESKQRVVKTVTCSDGVIRERICLNCGKKSVSTEKFDPVRQSA